MENYFNRKSIRPADYLQAEKLQSLRNIWEKYHHKITGRNTKIDKIPSIAELTKTISSNYPTLNTPDIKFNKNQSTLCINFK
jgi:transposase-like protein